MSKFMVIVYDAMIFGGSTSSLIAFLKTRIQEGWTVDLALFNHDGPLQNAIPNQVNVVQPVYPQQQLSMYQKLLLWLRPKVLIWSLKTKAAHPKVSLKHLQRVGLLLRYARPLSARYDVGIAYLEGLSHHYLEAHVQAKVKFAWIHTGLMNSGAYNSFDLIALKNMKRVIFVSEEDHSIAKDYLNPLKISSAMIENKLDFKELEKRSLQYAPSWKKTQGPRLLTVARIDYASKAFDRTLQVLSRLSRLGFEFTYTIVGDGFDAERLKQDITRLKLEERVVTLGFLENPMPWIKEADLLLLPSYYEGKPMIIKEALGLKTPVFITQFPSAASLITHDVEGYIAKNNEEAIFDGLKITLTSSRYQHWKQQLNLKSMDEVIHDGFERMFTDENT